VAAQVPSSLSASSEREPRRIAPIPGTKRVSRVEENTAADGIELSAGQIQRLNDLTPATGERHDETNMSTVDR
jgi:diketogulonate reductase-like aldo/keto reductase